MNKEVTIGSVVHVRNPFKDEVLKAEVLRFSKNAFEVLVIVQYPPYPSFLLWCPLKQLTGLKIQ